MSRKNRSIAFVALSLFIGLFVGFIGLGIMEVRATPTPVTPQQATPPVLVASTPEDGSLWQGEPVVLTFDRAMHERNEEFLVVNPDLDGTVKVDGPTITFTPTDQPDPGQRYTFTLRAAIGADGEASNAPVELSLTVPTPLAVLSTTPADGAQDVAANTSIVVMFNRPVVPLTGIDAGADLPQPLRIEPTVDGKGEWVSTSVYAFTPEPALAGGTTYQVSIDELVTFDDVALEAPFAFGFTTANPIATEVWPSGEAVAPDTDIRVTFSQPMDPDSTAKAFRLERQDDGTIVAGEIAWNEGLTEFTFAPDAPLQISADYMINVSTEARPDGGQGNLREPVQSAFRVVPLPSVDFTMPLDGDSGVPIDDMVRVHFTAPLSPTLALAYINVTPVPTTTDVISYYTEYEGSEIQIYWPKEAQTAYTVTIGAETGDPYGNTLGEDYRFSFTTGDYPALIETDLERFTHFTAFTTTVVAAYYRNVAAVDAELYRLPLDELYELAGPNQWEAFQQYEIPDPEAHRIWARSYPATAATNEVGVRLIELQDEAGTDLPPGAYLLQIERPPTAEPVDPNLGTPLPTLDNYVIIISNYNLVIKQSQIGESLAWLTDLATGTSVADAPITFRNGKEILAEGVTDADGIVMTEVRVQGEQSWEPVLAVSGAPGESIFAVASTEWSEGIAPWNFDLPSGYGEQSIQSFFYTDRPIYRPGDSVYWKGILREVSDQGYRLPSLDVTVDITVRNERGEEIQKQTLSPNEHGTLNGVIELADEAPTGFYYLEALIQTGAANPLYAGAGFQVASYRKPEFEITFTPEQDEYVRGETVRVALDAAYFSGGPLVGAPVTWRIIGEPYVFTWADAPSGRSYSFQTYDPDEESYDPYRTSSFGGLIMEGEGSTDEAGRFLIETEAILDGFGSQRWLIDATVQSAADQFVSNRVSVPVHASDFYIGISPQSYVVPVGDPAPVDLITLEAQGSPHSTPYPGATLDVAVYEFMWNSVYTFENGEYVWKTDVERTPVYSTTVTTDRDGVAAISFTPEKAGQYQVTAAGVDAQGNRTASAAFVYASSGEGDFVPWPRENNDRLELVTDKDQYAPGDTAKILVPSPFMGPVEALVTVERGGVIDARRLTLASNSTTLEIPITADAIPNIFVSVVLVKGVDETNPFAGMGVGMVELPVDVAEKTLTLAVTAKGERAGSSPSASEGVTEVAPGETVSYTIDVTDSTGAPVPNAEMSVALVDKAIFSLSEGQDTRSLLEVFYARRSLGVRTGALLVINEDRLSQQLAEGPKGGGGGGDASANLEVREEFQDLAYWDATLLTDEQGQASFSVTLPDNLTTWVLVVRAITDETLVGDGLHELTATKDLQIRPVVPRFFTAGDRAKIGAVLINTTRFAVEDLQLTIGVDGASADGATDFTADLGPGEQMRFDLPITVDGEAAEVELTFSASGEIPTPQSAIRTAADATRLAIPINRYVTPETVSTAGQVPPEGRTEAVLVPGEATEDGALIVTVEPSLAAGMVDGLAYLEHYPYECNEQTVSRFLPNALSLRTLRVLDIEDPALADQLAYQVGVGVQMLTNRQNADGGWGYWPNEASSSFISSYVLWGLWTVQEMGYTVPEGTLERAVDYLERQYQAPDDISESWQLNELAFMHFVLAEMGEGDPGRAATLYDVRERLGHYGQAYLAMALADMNDGAEPDPRVETLLDDLFGAAQISASGASWHEEEVDFQTLNTDLRSTAIILETFIRLDPEQPLLGNVVRWLMSARESGRWSTTQETAWSIIALTDWLAATDELQADYAWTVDLNNAEMGSGQVAPENIAEPSTLVSAVEDLLRDEINTLRFERSNASGQMYYTTDLRYTLDALAVGPRDRGIAVERRFATQEGERITGAAVGDVISVTTTIVAPQDLYHLLVEVPFPAGTEPIDTSLATESALMSGPDFETVDDPVSPWQAWVPTATDLRDDKLALFATYLPAGTYQYTFQLRAGLPGEYRVLPVHAEQMYFPEVWGRGAGEAFVVTE